MSALWERYFNLTTTQARYTIAKYHFGAFYDGISVLWECQFDFTTP